MIIVSMTDYSAEVLGKELERAKQFRQQLEKFNDLAQLNPANRVDVRILRDNIDNEIFGIEELKEREWNPLVYNQSLANSLYLIVARDFAPAVQRLPNLRKRMEKIPAVLAQAKTTCNIARVSAPRRRSSRRWARSRGL